VKRIAGLVLVLLLAACTTQDNAPGAQATSAVPVAPTQAVALSPATSTTLPATTSPPTATPSASSVHVVTTTPTAAPAEPVTVAWSYPIGLPDRTPGDGLFIRHGYSVENTWYNPGYWHTGEDWYALEGDTAGAAVYAAADGEVVYAGSNYPGRVVIVRHADGLYSMYGHLDPALAVRNGQPVTRGQQLGQVLRRTDDVPNHLHFETRSFLTSTPVNGEQPRYGFRCGRNCAPGPGYWPIAAPDLPSALGWRNPTHVINRRAFAPETTGDLGEVVVATPPISSSVTLWAEITEAGTPLQSVGEFALQAGQRLALLALRAGPEDSQATSAQSYQLWYRVRLADGREGWIAAAVPSDFETGSDGRPSTTRFNLLPAFEAGP
jgi:murein DD-endopeptidase MepM/ murein hydrolase activator NlpD